MIRFPALLLVLSAAPALAETPETITVTGDLVHLIPTAPDDTADQQVNIGWVTCQDYLAGTYGAYRQMIIDDDALSPMPNCQTMRWLL